MRVLLQRVHSAQVQVHGESIASIPRGLLVFVGIHKLDNDRSSDWMLNKVLNARIFEDDAGKMGRSVQDISGAILIVSQFTLYGDLRKGARPDFGASMPALPAKEYYDKWVSKIRQSCTLKIEEGRFGAKMDVQLINDGPVTLMIDDGV